MSWETLPALAVAVFILGATPGPGVFATMARAMTEGFGAAMVFVAGVVTGDLIYLLAAVFGLSFLATQFAVAFAVVKVLGGAYLVYLGVRLWLARPVSPTTDAGAGKRGGAFRGYLGGLALTLGNPKVVFFYVGFLPTFVDLAALGGGDVVMVAAVVAVTLGATMSAYAWAGARSGRALRSARWLRVVNRGAGTVMIGAGVVVASS